MKRIDVILLVVFAIFCTIIAAPASAVERCVEPDEYSISGGWSFPRLCFEYQPGGTVRLTAALRSGFPVEELLTDISFPDGSRAHLEQELEVSVENDSESFTPASEVSGSFDNRIFLGEITEPGDHDISMLYLSPINGGEGAEAALFFDLRLPTFDLEESVCVLNKRAMMLRLNIFTLEGMPDTAGLQIEYNGKEILNMQSLRVQKHGGFGSIELPMPMPLYRRVFQNMKAEVAVTANGERVVRTIHFPHRAKTHSSCVIG